MSYHVDWNSKKILRRAFVCAAMLGCAVVPHHAFADVAPLPSGLGSSGGTNSTVVDKLLSDSQKAIKSGNIRLALINLKNAVNAAPHNGVARAQLGTLLLAIGDESGAERELRQARKDNAPVPMVLPPLFQVMLARNESQLLLDQFPDPGEASKNPAAADILKARAFAFQSLKKPSEAINAMDRSLALRRDGSGLATRARLAQSQGNFPEAMKFIDEAIAKSNDPSAMLFKLGLLVANQDNDAALNLANQLLAKYPDNMLGRFGRIEAYLALKQDAKAKEEVDDIIAKTPNAPMGIYYKALLLSRAGDAKAAWNFAQSIPEQFRDSQPRVAVMISQMAVDSGNEETAAALLNRVLAKYPDLAVARVRLASIRLKQNSPAAALEVLTPVRESSDAAVVGLLSNIYLRLHRNDEALDALKKLDTATKGRADVKRSIALLEIQMGHLDQGIKDLSQAVSRDPTNPSLAGPLINVLAQTRRFPEALAVADKLGSDPKRRSAGLVYRGAVLILQHDNTGALSAFDSAVKNDPRNIEALYSRSEFLAAQQRFAEANRDLRAILALDAKNMPAMMKLAEVAALQGAGSNVQSILEQAIASSPQNARPRLALMRYFAVNQKYKESLAATNDLLRVESNNTDGIAFLGQLQFNMGQKKEAVATYRRLVALMPTNSTPQILLGSALSATGDSPGAARAMETAVKLDPSSAGVRAAQINLQLEQRNMDAAVASARSFQSSNPGTDADLMLADTLEKAKLRDEAVSVLNKSLSTKPNRNVLLRLTRLAAQANDYKRVDTLISNWLASNPADEVVRTEYATLLMQRNDSARATAQYQMVLKQDPNNVVALNNLGWLLQTSDPKRAVSLLTLAQKLSPNSADVVDTLGWVKLQQKDVAGGLALLNRAHTMQPKDAEISYHLVVALDANVQRESARQLLKTLLASGATFKDKPAAAKLAAAWH